MRSHHVILVLIAAGVVAAAYGHDWRSVVLDQASPEVAVGSPSADAHETQGSADAPKAAPPRNLQSAPSSAGIVSTQHAEFVATKSCIAQAEKLRVLDLKQRQCSSVQSGTSSIAECQSIPEESKSAHETLVKSACTTDPVRLQEALTSATAKAARAGDADAQVCFIDGGYFPTDDADVAAYRSEAANFVQTRLQAGDWRVVQVLATSPESISHRHQTLASQVNVGLPFTAYRATRLLQYGAEGVYERLLEQDARSLSRDLSSAQVANADEWAKEQFVRNFARSDKLSKAPATCLSE